MPAAGKPSWEESLSLISEGNGVFKVDFPSAFCFGNRGHGGFIVTMVTRAARLHLVYSHQRPDLPDVMDLKATFLRMVTPGPLDIRFEDLLVGKKSAILQAKLIQHGKLDLVVLLSLGDLVESEGPSFDVNFSLAPAPPRANLPRMASDSDALWISYQHPWDTNLYARAMAYAKIFVPRQFAGPSIRDHWVTNTERDPAFTWTNEHIPYLTDIIFTTSENYQGARGLLSHERLIPACEQQQRDREAGRPLSLGPADPNADMSPVLSYTTSYNMEVKKRLPPAGAKWLFLRNSTHQIKDGRMDWSITVMDEAGELVALVHQLHNLIEASNNPQVEANKGISKI